MPSLVPSNLTLDDPEGSKSTAKSFDSKYLKNGDRHEVGPREYLYVESTGFRLAPSDITLDDYQGSKIKVIPFDVQCVKNGNNYDVGPNGDYIDCPWTLLWMTLKGYKSRAQSFDSKCLENNGRYDDSCVSLCNVTIT